MLKIKKIMILVLVSLFLVPLVLLSACDNKTYISYEEAYEKLESAGYGIRGLTDKNEISEAVQELTASYNGLDIEEKGGYYDEYAEMDANAINVKNIILASKGDSRAILFYCEDEESAIMVSYALNATYGRHIGEHYGGQDKNFTYLYTADVNDILKLA